MFNYFFITLNAIKSNFTIKDLENISGIKAHTIRIWEKRYNLLQPKRSETNIRYYSDKSLLKLLNIALLNKNGIKVSKIAKMSEEDLIKNSKEVAFNQGIQDEYINSFKMAMFQFNTTLFHNTYNELLQIKTFQEIFKEVFIPFLKQIGLLWQTNTLLPAHEHFISNLIIQKIQTHTEKMGTSVLNNQKTYVLYLPENEIHELGLLYTNYELTLKGNKTIYLGQNLPLNNLSHFFKNEEEICFITVLTIMPYDDKLEDYFRQIEKLLGTSKHQFVAIGNKAIKMADCISNKQIYTYSSVTEFLKKI